MQTTAARGRPNRLINEKSPYLLQHAYNPVDWYPWGPEAFEKARREDKPIFLSIGYSTCYWCHVMERESFENTDVARLLNDLCVPIKVDREERPDLDTLYMTAVTAMTGRGGWPMTVFLTPDGQPFWGGTYFPPDDRQGLRGMTTILPAVSQAWRTRRQELIRSSQALTNALRAGTQQPPGGMPTAALLEQAAHQYAEQYDAAHGGFGAAPKFPRPHALSFLLRVWSRGRASLPKEMVEATLEAMARGGVRDHVGGGFHRYATDEEWLVPHFEKMLYDQALIARAYLEAYQATGHTAYAEIARETFAYVLRDLRDPGGAFYAAEDAGEVGQEGAFYVWTPQGIADAIGDEPETERICRLYGVRGEGNFEHGTSVLHLARPIPLFAKLEGLPEADVRAKTAAALVRLRAARDRRPRPHRDDKILTDWNGLMIGALAYGGRVLDEPGDVQAAGEAAEFLLSRLQRDGQLLHRWRDGAAEIPAFLDDYAFLSWGCLELYDATFDIRWLTQAQRLATQMRRLFWDEAHGGFFLSGGANEPLIAKTKELYDGALPSGNSVAALVLTRLARLLGDASFGRCAEQLFAAFSSQAEQSPHAFPQFLTALDAWLGPSQEIVIAGDPADARTRRLIREVSRRFLPRAEIVVRPSGEGAAAVEQLIPFARGREPLQGVPSAYVCQDRTCQLPVSDPTALAVQLEAPR